MHKLFYQRVRKSGLIPVGSHVLVAVSGGADSISLLCLLHECERLLKIKLSVAHLNHMIRGGEADGDEQYVKDICRKLKIRVMTDRVDVPDLSRRRRISVEMAAREARYAFLQKAAKRFGADMVVTAHTADDQAETFILKLARGAGADGLGGISPVAIIGGLRVVRPLLEFNRTDVEAYLNGRAIKWREDSTNRDTEYLRNRVRREIIPVLERKLNPSIKKSLCKTAEILREDHVWLDSLTKPLLLECMDKKDLRIDRLAALPPAAARRVIQFWLSDGGVGIDSIGFELIEKMRFLAQNAVKKVQVTDRVFAMRRSGRIVLEKEAVTSVKKVFKTIKIPGETIIPEMAIKVVARLARGVVRERKGRIMDLPANASMAWQKGDKLVVRSWRLGDRISPFGMAGSKKLQDIFIDAKVPRDDRALIPVFVIGKEIVWIPGYRISSSRAVSSDAAKCLHLSACALNLTPDTLNCL